MKVLDILSEGPIPFCYNDSNVKEACITMCKYNTSFLPVLDGEKQVIGVISNHDICRALVDGMTGTFFERNVADLMTPHVFSCNAEDEIDLALKIIRLNKVEYLPVVDLDSQLNGVISVWDILHAIYCTEITIKGHYNVGENNLFKTLNALSDKYLQYKTKEVEELNA